MRRLMFVVAFALLFVGCVGDTDGPFVPDRTASPVVTTTSPEVAPPASRGVWEYATLHGARATDDATLGAEEVSRLGVAWSFETDGAVTGTPTVKDGRVFVGTWNGSVYAIDADDGTAVWTRTLGAQIDASVTLWEDLAFVGDAAGRLHALDAATGATRWTRIVDDTKNAHLYATPQVVPRPDRSAVLIVPVASDQESSKLHGDAPVDFRGSVVAYALPSGDELWRTRLVPMGATGAPVWGSTVYDAVADLILFGTGNAYTEPATELTDAIVALRPADGSIAWSLQATEGDVYTQASPQNPDHDFGSTGSLFDIDGRRVFAIGQKSALFWAVDVVTGELVWRHGERIYGGEGIIGDSATHEGVVVVPYATLSIVRGLDMRDGSLLWEHALAGPAFADVSVAPGVAYVADATGAVTALGLRNGTPLWQGKVGQGSVFGGMSLVDGTLFVPVVRDGFLGKAGAVVAFRADGKGSTGTSSENRPDTDVRLRDLRFNAAEIRVSAGTTVTFTNDDPMFHTVTSAWDDGTTFDHPLREGDAATVTFDTAGEFVIFCRPHAGQGSDGTWRGMVMRVIVT